MATEVFGEWRSEAEASRHSKRLATKAEAEKSNEHLLNLYNKEVTEVPTVEALVKRYKAEEMPERKSTRRGYETWLKNYTTSCLVGEPRNLQR